MRNNWLPRERLNFVIQALVTVLIIALPFDNAAFHSVSILLFLATCGIFYAKGLPSIARAFNSQKYININFAIIWAIMFIANLINDQGYEAWRTFILFGFRYWMLFFVLTYLLAENIISISLIFKAAIAALLIQFLPFVHIMVDGSIFLDRFRGFMHSPNVLGFYSALGAILAFQCCVIKTSMARRQYAISILLGAMSLITLIASGSRGSWVAFAAAAGLFAAFYIRQSPKIILTIGTMTALSAAFMLTQFEMVARRLDMLLAAHPSLRDKVWDNALSLFEEKPLFGYGMDTRAIMLENHSIYYEHNIFISILLACGIFGLLAYISLLGLTVRSVILNGKIYALVCLVLLLSAGMFAFDFYRHQTFMTIFVFVTAISLQPFNQRWDKETRFSIHKPM